MFEAKSECAEELSGGAGPTSIVSPALRRGTVSLCTCCPSTPLPVKCKSHRMHMSRAPDPRTQLAVIHLRCTCGTIAHQCLHQSRRRLKIALLHLALLFHSSKNAYRRQSLDSTLAACSGASCRPRVSRRAEPA